MKTVRSREGSSQNTSINQKDDQDETTWLLRSPANGQHLMEAIRDLNAGKGKTFESVEALIAYRHEER
ncbi:hypothetical protein J4G53_25430 [Serratia ureilytica]|uniref:hypothetical protein n=1 Tax=Serratia ureilytica TaxID=300181 RepID=UPI001AA15A7F|nr:hypothetical protein [Serratia ureilytica]MBO1811575.1 hypothetical protein [Serratia ureilytica]